MNNQRGIWVRLYVLFLSLGTWAFAFFIAAPWFEDALRPFLPSMTDGVARFVDHLLFYSFPTALMCAAMWFLLIKLNFVRGPQLRTRLVRSVIVGAIVGTALAIVTVLIAPGLWNFKVYPHFDSWVQAGNLFSNTWEEIEYRGLIYLGGLFAFRNPVVAAVLSGAVFGWTHQQYPFTGQIYVGVVGFALALTFERTKNFVTPVVGHVVLDLICDSFLH